MSRGPVTLALGVDVGASRTRVALCRRHRDGTVELVAVAARATGDRPDAALRDAWTELRTPQRRCVASLGAPDALLRAVRFPPMPRAERARAAAFEARRLVAPPEPPPVARVVSLPAGDAVLAVARRAALASRSATARDAGLRCAAVDDAALALLRALPGSDIVVDLGARRTVVIAAAEPIPEIAVVDIGGDALTAAVVASLAVDADAAERRKRTVGLAGAGEYARDALIEQLAVALATVRSAVRREPRAIVLAGNGARLHGLDAALERAVAVPVRIAEIPAAAAPGIPADVLRTAAADWALAYGLALWEAAA